MATTTENRMDPATPAGSQIRQPTRGRPRDPSRDQAILEATVELLAEVGYESTSIEAVATRAGVSKPTIYRRWPEGKEQLVSAAVAQCREDVPQINTGSLRSDLVALLDHMISGMRENAHLAAGLAQRLRESPQLARLFREEIMATKRQSFVAILERAVERGELIGVPVDSGLLADLGPSVIHTRALITGDPLDSRFVNQFVDQVLIPVLKAVEPDGARDEFCNHGESNDHDQR